MKHTVTEVTLQNGLKGLVLHVPDAPVVSVEISFRAGEFLLTRNKWETAHIMEHLMLGANKSYASAREFAAELEKNGAYSNASTSAYDIAYEAECASFESGRVLKLFVEALQSPVFKQSEFTAEFGNVAEELEGRSNNHFRTLNLALREALGFYSVSDSERITLMHNVKLADIKNHYQTTHSVQNARFLLAGPVTGAELDILASLKLPAVCERKSLPNESPVQANCPVVITRKDVPNIYFYIDTYAPSVLDQRQKDALTIVSTLLTETLHSKLLGTAREQGLVYAMGSGQQHLKLNSSFWLGAQVSKKNVSKLFDLIKTVIQDLKNNGVTAAELDGAKQYMKGKHARSAQTVTGLLSKYSYDYFQTDTFYDEALFVDRIQAITKQDVSEVVQLVTSGNWALGILGDVSTDTASMLYAKAEGVLH